MKLGTWGEEVAANFLKRKGYEILEKNYRNKIGEIDIIIQKNSTIIFVEVKTRKNLNYGLPCEAITKEKKHHIIRTAIYYMQQNYLCLLDMRVDVVEILKKDDKTFIRHLENVFT